MLRPKLAFVSKRFLFVALVALASLLDARAEQVLPKATPYPKAARVLPKSTPAPMVSAPNFYHTVPAPGRTSGTYEILKNKAFKIEEDDTMQGWSYVISGGVAVAISIPAYFMTQDIFAQTIFSLGETLGVASVGYGSYLVLVQNDYTRFEKILSKSALTPAQRDELSLRFLEENAKRARAVRKIRVITHGLTAGLNILNGVTASNSQLKTALFFLGGINILAAIHFISSESEEEKFYKTLADRKWELVVPPGDGPAFAFQLHF